jgi:N-acetylglutamate synthase-like GNAT family acetyltransferase
VNGFKITSDPNGLDFEMIHQFISQNYWAKNIPHQTLSKAISNSLVFSVYTDTGKQVGFARVITDKATFAYLGDVFILDSYRGLGLSKFLMETLVSHSDLQGLRRFMLATSDVHGLYSSYGFQSVENPEILMKIWQPSIYESERV